MIISRLCPRGLEASVGYADMDDVLQCWERHASNWNTQTSFGICIFLGSSTTHVIIYTNKG